MNTAAIANHLNVAESAITEIQEWARVLWVRVKGLGARFVSKKVGIVMAAKGGTWTKSGGVRKFVPAGGGGVGKDYPQSIEHTMYTNPESLRGVRTGDTFRVNNEAVYTVTKILNEEFVWEKNGIEYTNRPSGYSEEKYRVQVSGTFRKMVDN